MTFSNIDITNFDNLSFSIFLAENDDGSNEDWDGADYVHITYSIDGGAVQNLLWVESETSGTNGAPLIDTDFDGLGDGTEITPAFAQFTEAIAGTGSSLELTIEIALDAGDEDIAIDNVQITGDAVSTDPTVSFVATTYAVSELDVDTTIQIGVVMDQAPSSDVVVNVFSIDDTAVEPGDYTFADPSLTFTTTATYPDTQFVSLTIIADNVAESTESLDLLLEVDSGVANEGDDQTTVTISDDDAPQVGFDNATTSVTESDATQVISVPITLSNYGGTPVTLDVVLLDGTSEMDDYMLNTTTLTFNANGTQNISIDINDDADFDDETFTIVIAESTSTNANVDPDENAVTVTDDDVAPTPTIIAVENFDGAGPQWSNDAATQTFTDPSSPSEGLFIQASSTGSGFNGNVLYGRDLLNETGEPQLTPVTITFSPVNVTGATDVTVEFDYDVNGFDATDEITYEVFVDGSGQGAVALPKDAQGTVSVNVPDGSTSVALTLELDQNGGGDDFELDSFRVNGIVTLPVELTTFTARPEGAMVALAWETATESNSEYFAVERSVDGKSFEQIGTVAAAGTSYAPVRYAFVDDAPAAGVSYYRLRQADFDGAYEYSEVVAISLEGKRGTAQIVPTLVSSQFDIVLDEAAEQVDVQIFSANGQLVQAATLAPAGNRATVSAERLPAGLYIVRVATLGQVTTARFVKQ